METDAPGPGVGPGRPRSVGWLGAGGSRPVPSRPSHGADVRVADRHLPTVPPPTSPGLDRPPGTDPARPGDGAASGRRGGDDREGAGRSRRAPRWVGRFVVTAVVLAGGLILTLGLASLVGDAVREAVLVEVDASPVGSQPSYSDAPAEAATFFARRDSVEVRVPRDMTLADFLGLYHLETSTAARDALREQLGVVADDDVLREGDRVTLTITVPRAAR